MLFAAVRCSLPPFASICFWEGPTEPPGSPQEAPRGAFGTPGESKKHQKSPFWPPRAPPGPQRSYFAILGSILGPFLASFGAPGAPKNRQKGKRWRKMRRFSHFFNDLLAFAVFSYLFCRFWVDFWKARPLRNHAPVDALAVFTIFRKFTKNMPSETPKSSQNRTKLAGISPKSTKIAKKNSFWRRSKKERKKGAKKAQERAPPG